MRHIIISGGAASDAGRAVHDQIRGLAVKAPTQIYELYDDPVTNAFFFFFCGQRVSFPGRSSGKAQSEVLVSTTLLAEGRRSVDGGKPSPTRSREHP